MISSLFPDNGLASLAGTLISKGHEAKVLDFNTVGVLRQAVSAERTAELKELLPVLRGAPDPAGIDRLLEANLRLEGDMDRFTDRLIGQIAGEVDAQRSDFVGFKLWSGDGFIISVRIAEALRTAFPDLKLYGGGPAVVFAEHGIFDYTDVFDALVDGEGEQAIVGLADYAIGKRELSSIPNLIVRDNGSFKRTARSRPPDLNELASPIYDPEIYPSLSGDEQIRLFVLDESRGCPMRCAFCIHRSASGDRWRVKSAGRILDEIGAIGDLHGVSSFRFGGSYTPGRFLTDLAEQLTGAGKPIRFCGFAHPEGIPVDRLEGLAAAGCRSLFFGVESFDAGDLNRLGKKLKPERARATVRACLDAGIVPVVAVIVPIPGQTPEALQTNREALTELCAGTASTVAVSPPALTPRTQWWAERSAHGFELLVDEEEYRRVMATFKVRHLVPPAYWDPLPYKLEGMTFTEYAGANARFQKELAASDIIINIPDDVALLADVTGESLRDISGRFRSLLITLDAEAVGATVADINRRLRGSIEC
jgi:radical SAM superfamily enzyme YgiQ (UPF0313 family)